MKHKEERKNNKYDIQDIVYVHTNVDLYQKTLCERRRKQRKVLQIGLKKHNFASCLGKDTTYDDVMNTSG